VHGAGGRRNPPPGVRPHRVRLPDDAAALVAETAPDVVFHLACPIDLGRDPALLETLRPGILDATVAVARACLRQGSRLVHVGTCAEYGDNTAPFSEADAPRPVSPYGALKAAATHNVLMLARVAGLRACVVRPFRAHGPHDTDSFIAGACRAAWSGLAFQMTDGAQVREWNTVESIAAGMVAAGAHPAALGRIINLGGGPRASVRRVAELIFALAGAAPGDLHVGAYPRRPGEVESFWGDHAVAASMWGPIRQPPLLAALRRTLEWHR